MSWVHLSPPLPMAWLCLGNTSFLLWVSQQGGCTSASKARGHGLPWGAGASSPWARGKCRWGFSWRGWAAAKTNWKPFGRANLYQQSWLPRSLLLIVMNYMAGHSGGDEPLGWNSCNSRKCLHKSQVNVKHPTDFNIHEPLFVFGLGDQQKQSSVYGCASGWGTSVHMWTASVKRYIKNITFNIPWSGLCSDLSGSSPKEFCVVLFY